MPLSDLQGEFQRIAFHKTVESLLNPDIATIPDLSTLSVAASSNGLKTIARGALWTAGKRLGVRGNARGSRRALIAAREFGTGAQQLLNERIAATSQIPDRTGIEWKIRLQDMQREFAICSQTPCICQNHFQTATCLGLFGDDKPEMFEGFGLSIPVLGLYHSWSLCTTWSKLIRRVKLDGDSAPVPFMARILADWIALAQGNWREADVLVPVPPSTVKFAKRGFAPTDQLAKEIGVMLGIPVRSALLRSSGTPTRDASYDDLLMQFSVDAGRWHGLEGARLLLIEDVVTTGTTVSVCAGKLAAAGAGAVAALALARSTRI